MDKLDHIINKSSFSALDQVIKSFDKEKKIKKNWKIIFGKLAEDISFSHIRGQQIIATTTNPLWINEIQFFKFDLLSKLNKYVQTKTPFSDIKLQLAAPKKKKKETFKKTTQTKDLETQIKEVNQRKKKQGYWRCPTCLFQWKKEENCLFCQKS